MGCLPPVHHAVQGPLEYRQGIIQRLFTNDQRGVPTFEIVFGATGEEQQPTFQAGLLHLVQDQQDSGLAADPLMEQVHCDAVRLWHRLGNRAAVTRQYEALRQLLVDELAATPLLETEALYRKLTGSSAAAGGCGARGMMMHKKFFPRTIPPV